MNMSGGQASGGTFEEGSNVVWVHAMAPAAFVGQPASLEACGSSARPVHARTTLKRADAVSRIFGGAKIKMLAALISAAMAAASAGASFSSAVAAAVLVAVAIASSYHSARASSEPPVSSPNCWPQGWF
jgi:hypothetical protein